MHAYRFPKPVRLIARGGTIEKDYSASSELPELGPKPHTDTILRISGAAGRVIFERMDRQLDSDKMVDADRQEIIDRIAAARRERRFVIGHGTGTLTTSMAWVQRAVNTGELRDDTVAVFSGAMRPYRMGNSDGPFNVGGAVLAARILEPTPGQNVWLAFNGELFDWNDAIKDTHPETPQFLHVAEYRGMYPEVNLQMHPDLSIWLPPSALPKAS